MGIVNNAFDRVNKALVELPQRPTPAFEQYPGSMEALMLACGRACAESGDKAALAWAYELPMPELSDEQHWWFVQRLIWAGTFLRSLQEVIEDDRIYGSTESLLHRMLVYAWRADGLQRRVQDSVILLLRERVSLLTPATDRILIKGLEVFLEPEVHQRI